MRVYDRDLIRGGHYGQRSCEPHLQAEHMAAPTNAAKREESSCQLGAVHTWHLTDVGNLPDVRFGAKSRHCQVYAEPHHVDDVELIGLNKPSDGSCRLDAALSRRFVGTRPLLLGGVL